MGRNLEKERFWRNHLERYSRSDLTIRAYCNQEGLSECSFYWWRRELPTRGGAHDGDGGTGFARLEVVEPQCSGDAVTIEFPDGVCIRFSSSVDESVLRTVLSALRETSSC